MELQPNPWSLDMDKWLRLPCASSRGLKAP